MFFEGPTIGFNGFSMVFKILRAMVNDDFDVCHANFNAKFIVEGTGISVRCEELLKGNGISGGAARVS